MCTSLEKAPSCKWSTGEELKTATQMEIGTVKALVQQCVDNWPMEWGEKDLSKICVMIPTRYAVCYTYAPLKLRYVGGCVCNLFCMLDFLHALRLAESFQLIVSTLL